MRTARGTRVLVELQGGFSLFVLHTHLNKLKKGLLLVSIFLEPQLAAKDCIRAIGLNIEKVNIEKVFKGLLNFTLLCVNRAKWQSLSMISLFYRHLSSNKVSELLLLLV